MVLYYKKVCFTILALMEAASFCGRVCHKRYSGQQETAPQKTIS